MAGCTQQSGDEAMCTCVLDVFERTVPLDELGRLGGGLAPSDEGFQPEDLPPEFLSAIVECQPATT